MISVQLFKNHEGNIVTIRRYEVATARGPRPVRAYTNLTQLDAISGGLPNQHTAIALFRAATETHKGLHVLEEMVNRGELITYAINPT
jgi:hypothetical protein